ARTWRRARRDEYLEVAADAMRYSCTRLRPDGSWWYGEEPKYHWIDNFHTAYNLDSLKCYIESAGDAAYQPHLDRAFEYFKTTFFEASGRRSTTTIAPIRLTSNAHRRPSRRW